MIDLQIYCNCYRHREPVIQQFNQKNIMCGADQYDTDYIKKIVDKNYILDNTGDNISELNTWFGELTGTYWIWKNTDHEIVGTNQYRIFWETAILQIEPKTIYVPKKVDISLSFQQNSSRRFSVFDQYGICHGYDVWRLLFDLCQDPNFALRSSMIAQLRSKYQLSQYNMFVAKKSIFDKLCEILFEILFKFYDTYKDLLPEIAEKIGHNRTLDFLAERILNMIYDNINHYITNTKIVELNTRVYEKPKT